MDKIKALEARWRQHEETCAEIDAIESEIEALLSRVDALRDTLRERNATRNELRPDAELFRTYQQLLSGRTS